MIRKIATKDYMFSVIATKDCHEGLHVLSNFVKITAVVHGGQPKGLMSTPR